MTIEPEILRSALAHYRDRQFADMLVIVIGLAAETHPEEMRKALARVFDLSAVEETTRRMMALVSQMQAETLALKHDLEQLRIEADRINADRW